MKSTYGFLFGLAVVAVSLPATAPVLAQPGGFGAGRDMDPEERLEARLGFLDERLDLSAEQSEALQAILEKAQDEGIAWREQHPEASREDRMAFFKEHRASVNADIEKILNDEQKEAFAELKDFRGPGMRGRRGGRSMGTRLDLDEGQKAKLQSIHQALHNEADAWREANPNATREERTAFRAEHRKRRIELMGEVLSDAQVAQLEDRGRRFHRHVRRAGRSFGRAFRELNLSEEQKAAMREILTEEQNARLDSMLAHAKRGGFRGRPQWGGEGMLLNQLELNAEQEEQLKSMRESHRAAADAWHEANPDATREERRAFREAHREGMKAMLSEVLTEEQMAKLDSLKTNRPMGRRGGMHGWK